MSKENTFCGFTRNQIARSFICIKCWQGKRTKITFIVSSKFWGLCLKNDIAAKIVIDGKFDAERYENTPDPVVKTMLFLQCGIAVRVIFQISNMNDKRGFQDFVSYQSDQCSIWCFDRVFQVVRIGDKIRSPVGLL